MNNTDPHRHAAPSSAEAVGSCCHSKGAYATAPAIDPVCGMRADPAKAPSHAHAGITYYFCCEGCRKRFAVNPAQYLAPKPAPLAQPASHDAGLYTCPMHPEVQHQGPADCPKCGMALEPEAPSLDQGPDPELIVMRRRLWIAATLTLPVFLAAMSTMLPGGGAAAWLGMGTLAWGEAVLATPVVLWTGAFVFQRGWASVRQRSPNMWTLIALGSGAAWGYSVIALLFPTALPPAFRGEHDMPPLYFEAAAVITTLVILGQLLESAARARTSAAIRALMRLTPDFAHRIGEDGEQDVPLDQVAAGDRLRVRPGEKIPVDGVVVEGDSHVDESMLTGESAPQRKQAGAKLSAGTLNGQGSVVLRAEQVGGDTLLAGIVRLVAQAGRSRAPAQRLADRVAAWFVPVVVAIAALAALAWWLLGPAPAGAHALLAAVSVLIIACPCALGLATPISIMVGVGRGAHAGVLVRDAEALERLRQVDTLVIDKTGTLTEGKPSLNAVKLFGERGEAEVLTLAAAIESASGHPLARAIVAAARERKLPRRPVPDFGSEAGLGAWGSVGHSRVLVGNAALMRREAVQGELPQDRGTQVLVAIDGRLAATLELADAPKPGAIDALAQLRGLGLRVIMATGDSAAAAQTVAGLFELKEVHAGLLPQGKAELVRKLQAEGRRVAMAGDGINDAPALAAADVGIAMGGGADVALEAAGVTLLRGDLNGIVRGIRLSRATLRNIRQNLFFAFAYNLVGVPLAAGVLYPVFGILLSPMLASLAMSLSSVSVIGNALRLRQVRL